MRFLMPALLSAATAALPAAAQPSGYAGQQNRPVKALSAEETADLLAGHGMGMAKAGELNHFPGPGHVLELADGLRLTPEQAAAVRASFGRMSTAARTLGAELVGREHALDEAFRGPGPAPARLGWMTAEIAALQGRLRAVHLGAHLETKRLLSPEQVAAYDRLRGYGGPPGAVAPHRPGHPD